jgi:hypothetical protein
VLSNLRDCDSDVEFRSLDTAAACSNLDMGLVRQQGRCMMSVADLACPSASCYPRRQIFLSHAHSEGRIVVVGQRITANISAHWLTTLTAVISIQSPDHDTNGMVKGSYWAFFPVDSNYFKATTGRKTLNTPSLTLAGI